MTASSPLPSAGGVREAAARLKPHVVLPTPLVRSEILSAALGAEILLKIETVSPVASFKHRGALVELLRARDRGALRGAATSSTGNHGQGVAWAARTLRVPAHVFLPAGANPAKRAMIAAFGATIHDAGRDIDEAKDAAKELADRERLAFVDDGEGLGVMEGGGTVGLEIAERASEIDVVYVPMGSGSLAAGCATAVKAALPHARVVAVSSKGSPAMAESFFARKPVERPIATIADGLVCRVPARLALDALIARVDDVLLANDAEMLSGVRTLIESAHVLVEPSGAAGLVAAVKERERNLGKRVAIVLTGSNVETSTLGLALESRPLV